jgi:hypothetical protein
MSERFEMRVSEELLAKIDELRGREPRASFVKWVLEQYVAGMMEPRVVVPPSSPLERAEMEKVLGGADVRVEGGSVLPGRPQRHEFQSGAEWQEAVRAWKERRDAG